jgi:hypothetical protein
MIEYKSSILDLGNPTVDFGRITFLLKIQVLVEYEYRFA